MDDRDRLQQWMLFGNYNQTDLAQDLGYVPHAISQILSGRRKISSTFRLKFLRVFGPKTYEGIFGPLYDKESPASD